RERHAGDGNLGCGTTLAREAGPDPSTAGRAVALHRRHADHDPRCPQSDGRGLSGRMPARRLAAGQKKPCPLISQHTSGIVSGADRRFIAGALAAFLLTAGRIARRSYPLQSRLPGRDDGGSISQPDHMERPPIGLTVRAARLQWLRSSRVLSYTAEAFHKE